MRREIEGQGIHSGDISIDEIQLGDTVVLGKFQTDWEPLVTLNREASEIEFMREFPKSIFNSEGGSPQGKIPDKMDKWEINFGVVIQISLALPNEENVIVLSRTGKDEYTLFRSRETRHLKDPAL